MKNITETLTKKEATAALKADLANRFVEVFSDDCEQAKAQYAKDALTLLKSKRGQTSVKMHGTAPILCDSLICNDQIGIFKKSQLPNNEKNKRYSVTDQKSGMYFLEVEQLKHGKAFAAILLASGANLQNVAVSGFDGSNPTMMSALKALVTTFKRPSMLTFVGEL
jgi:hypothetical protein